MTAYREAGEAPCYKCDRATRELCFTCQRPTCDRHLDQRRMCGKCDEALYRYMKTEGMGITFILPGFLMAGMALGLAVPALLPVAVALPFVGFPTALYVRKRRRAARFFRTMRERGAPPEPADARTDVDVELDRIEDRIGAKLRK